MVVVSWVRWAPLFLLFNRAAAHLLSSQVPLSDSDHHEIAKRVAIVGAGPSGISALKAFITGLPEEARRTWQIVVFEKRDDIGGIWYDSSIIYGHFITFFINRYPDNDVPEPPELPATPLYSLLRTNTPHPTSA